MRNIKPTVIDKLIIAVVSFVMIAAIPLTSVAQSTRGIGSIEAGTTIYVRTNEEIDTGDDDGQVFSGMVDRNVLGRNGRVVIPRGAHVDLVVKELNNNEVGLDLESVDVNGQQYGLDVDQNVITEERKEGIGANDRTAKHVGGGAVLGAIIGAIAGGGKGAAIGAGAGAAAGAGVQVLTRGKHVKVPAETLLTFRLAEPLRPLTTSYYGGRNANNSANRQDGRYNNRSYTDSRYYYENGVRERASVSVGRDRNVRWNGPRDSSIYVEVDGNNPKLFASGASGTQPASWMRSGHLYEFVMTDRQGDEIARTRWDLR